MAHIGFLGAGNMGFAMASRLLATGHSVSIYNRTESKTAPLVRKGATYSRTPQQAAQNADAIISMVGDDHASEDVWLGEYGALSAPVKPSTLIIECSTLSHDFVLKLSKRAKALNLSYLDCPVTGLPEAAAVGELTLFLGGSHATISAAQPYLKPMSSSQIHFGEIGAGTAYKLIVNLMGSIQILATAEALIVAENAGLDTEMVANALAAGGAGSPNVARLSKLMVTGNHQDDVIFNAGWRFKDTQYGVDFSKKMGVSTELGQSTQQIFQQVITAGYADLSESKIIDIVRQG